jgi:hypothetical protein
MLLQGMLLQNAITNNKRSRLTQEVCVRAQLEQLITSQRGIKISTRVVQVTGTALGAIRVSN